MPPGFESLPLRYSLGFVLTFLLILSGCAALPLESSRIPHPTNRSNPALPLSFHEAIGVIHIHSTYSDGSQPVEAIARIAQSQELDFIILTDHNTLAGRREGKAGWCGKTLVLIDEEISTSDGHYLGLKLPEEVRQHQSGEQTAAQVKAKGGLGFIAHPNWQKQPWKGGQTRGITGLEIYDAASDVMEENPITLGMAILPLGADPTLTWWLDRPDESLALWDYWLAQGSPVVGIGSPDAHGLTWAGLRLGPYGPLFKLVRNHLWVIGELTEESVYEALAQGRLFVAHDIVADARGFRFIALADENPVGFMGGRVQWTPRLKLYAYLPSSGELSFWKNGNKVAQADGQHGWFEPDGPGIYRVEATRKGRPWIYSNPIYVVE